MFCFLAFGEMKDIYSQPTDDGAQVENHPEPRNVPALRLLGWIGHHNRPLRRPKHPRTDAQNDARENDEALVRIVVVTQEAGDVKDVAQAAEAQGHFDTQTVGDGSGEEAEDAEGGIQGDAGIVGRLGVELTASAETAEGVEHAGAHEADECHEGELKGWRCVAGDFDRSEAVRPVFPSYWMT